MSEKPVPNVADYLVRAFSFGTSNREAEDYGDISLSVQASETHYSSPRVSGLPLDQYASVEVGFIFNGHLAYPSAAGIEGFDGDFEQGMNSPVAGYVSQDFVARLRAAIVKRVEAGAK